MKFLVISFAGIGDTIFATPLIHELRANFPKAEIDVFVRWRGSSDLLEGNPHVNAVHRRDLVGSGKLGSFKFLWNLRQRHYDVSLNTHPQSRVSYRAMARLIGADVRVSHEYDHAGPWDRLLINRSRPQDYQRHAVENNLGLLELIDCKPILPRHEYELFLKPAEQQWAKAFMAEHQLEGRFRFGIHVGSGGTKNLALRRWPVENYLSLIQRIGRENPGAAVLLFGGPDEEKEHERILSQTDRRKVLVVRSANMRQAAAMLGHCDAFLSVDTSLMHLAAAMKVPRQFVIETPSWNRPVEPYNRSFVLIKNPAVAGRNLNYYRYDGGGLRGTAKELVRCMESVSVTAVYDATAGALAEGRR